MNDIQLDLWPLHLRSPSQQDHVMNCQKDLMIRQHLICYFWKLGKMRTVLSSNFINWGEVCRLRFRTEPRVSRRCFQYTYIQHNTAKLWKYPLNPWDEWYIYLHEFRWILWDIELLLEPRTGWYWKIRTKTLIHWEFQAGNFCWICMVPVVKWCGPCSNDSQLVGIVMRIHFNLKMDDHFFCLLSLRAFMGTTNFGLSTQQL